MLRDSRYIKSMEIINKTDAYPFTIPSISNTEKIEFHNGVTYFIGENGCGKSTLLESLAISLKINPEGGNKNTRFSLLPTESILSHHIILNKSGRLIKDAFFFRAETFFNLYVAAKNDEIENQGYSWTHHGYKGLKDRSHGEGHLDIIANKMSNGVYIFDEPESGLSVEKQMMFLIEIDRLIKNGSQIMIATHSPVILSYPDSVIYDLTNIGLVKMEYEDSKPYKLMKTFITNQKRVVRDLLSE